MKKNVLKKGISFSVILMTLLLFSFNFSTSSTEKSNETNGYEWGRWQTTSCFRYFEYRVKKKDYQNEWAIEWRNGYNKNISFSVDITDGYGGDRLTVRSGESKKMSAYYTNNKNATSIRFTIDKVKFGDSSWGGPYAECDN